MKSTRRANAIALGAILVVLTLAAYWPALHAGFIWDDDLYVTQNRTLHSLDGLIQIWFKIGPGTQYYPLVYTTFWLEYHLWGLNPFGFHLVNVLLHALGAILLWRVLVRLQVPGAWLAAGVFALHPVQAESVAWITERKNVLSGVFYFGAALTYLRFMEWRDTDGKGKRYLASWWAALTLYLAALLTKTVTSSLPAALLLVRWWKKGRLQRRDVVPLLPFVVIGAALGLLTGWIEKHYIGAQGAEWSLTLTGRCLLAGRALWFYAGKLVWPAQLTFIYPRWLIDASCWWQWLFPIAAIALVATLWLVRGRIGRAPLVAVLFFICTLAPALGFINVYPFRYSYVADHFQYLASVGIIALVTTVFGRLPRAASVALIGLIAVLTWRQTAIYRDLESLWRDTLVKNPAAWMAHNNLGVVLTSQGRLPEAIQHYERAVQLKPDYAEACNNLGAALADQGNVPEAIQYYERALQLKPDYAEAYNNLGNALTHQGRLPEASQHYERAIQVKPDYAEAYTNLGNVLFSQGKPAEAIQNYEQAIQLKPDSAKAYNSLGIVLSSQGKLTDAIRNYEQAIQLNPNYVNALNNLAYTLVTSQDALLRNTARAVALSEQANHLAGGKNPTVLGTLATAYAEAGRYREAVETVTRAVQLPEVKTNPALISAFESQLELYRTQAAGQAQ